MWVKKNFLCAKLKSTSRRGGRGGRSQYFDSELVVIVLLIMLILVYVCTVITTLLHTSAFSRVVAVENYTQLDESFQVSYIMTMLKRKSVKGNFSTIKSYRVARLYPN